MKDRLEGYTTGAEFIESLFNEGGIELANKPLEEPPESFKEIENPSKYYDRVIHD